jgi:hypothetical protein
MLMSEIIAVINEIIDILAGLKAIGGDRQAELHAALEPQAEPEAAPEPEPAAEPDPTQ